MICKNATEITKAAGRMLDLLADVKKGDLTLNEAVKKAVKEYSRIIQLTGYQDE